ncbi:Uncharacterised protein [Mycobacteroides abscessus subsp. abscessus]|nr:Uncharacterised protein [Mycobacteroides abscessus subsp. abscessus]
MPSTSSNTPAHQYGQLRNGSGCPEPVGDPLHQPKTFWVPSNRKMTPNTRRAPVGIIHRRRRVAC